MKKTFLVLSLIVSLLLQPFFSLTFALAPVQEVPEVCHGATPRLQLYFDFQAEMAQTLLWGVLGEKTFNWNINPLGLFTTKVLRLNPQEEKDALVDRLLSNLVNTSARLLQSTTNTALLVGLSALSVLGSSLSSLKILFEDRPIVRDYKKLLQIETKLTQIAYYLGKKTRLLATLDTPEALYRIVEKYQGLGLFEAGLEQGEVSYFGILSDLIRMNATIKGFVGGGGNGGKIYQYSSLFNARLQEAWLAQLDLDYAFLRSGLGLSRPCNQKRTDTWKNLKKASQVSQSLQSFGQIVTSSTKKLSWALVEFIPESLGISLGNGGDWWGDMFTPEELQQLRTIYGVDTTKMTSYELGRLGHLIAPRGWWLKARNDAKKGAVSVVDTVNTRATAVLQTVRQGWNSFSDMGTALQQVPFSRLDLSTSQRSEFFRSLGLLYFIKFDDVLHEQSARSLYEAYDLALQTQELGLALQNVSDITPQFYAIVEQMEQLFNLIGDRSSGLRNALGDVCEYQASNKGIEHCRPSDF